MAASDSPVRKRRGPSRNDPLAADHRDALQLDQALVWVVIPCYQVKAHILGVLAVVLALAPGLFDGVTIVRQAPMGLELSRDR